MTKSHSMWSRLRGFAEKMRCGCGCESLGAGAGVRYGVRVCVTGCQYVPHADWIHDSSLLLLSAHVRARHRGLPAHLVRVFRLE